MPEGKGYTGSASDPKKGPVEAAQGGEVVKAGFGGAFRQSRRGRGGNRFRLGKGSGRGGSLVKQLRRRPGQGPARGGSTLGPAKKGFGNATAGSFGGGVGASAGKRGRVGQAAPIGPGGAGGASRRAAMQKLSARKPGRNRARNRFRLRGGNAPRPGGGAGGR